MGECFFWYWLTWVFLDKGHSSGGVAEGERNLGVIVDKSFKLAVC